MTVSASIFFRTLVYLALVLRAHYAICKYVFTVGFQYNFPQITVVIDTLLLCYDRFIELHLDKVGKFSFHFSRDLGNVVDDVNANPSALMALNHALG